MMDVAASLPVQPSASGSFALAKRTLLLAVTFLVGYELSLPVLPSDSPISVPYWATRMNIPGAFGLSVKEALLLVHAALNSAVVIRVVERRRLPEPSLLLLLFLLAALPSIVVGWELRDLPEAIRFGLMAYFVIALRMELRSTPGDALVATATAGLLLSMIINLALTFASPAGRIGLLPVLYGQNGPGGAAGLFVGTSAVLYRIVHRSGTRSLLISTVLVAICVVVLSLSKLGMLMAAAGVCAWIVVGATGGGRKRRIAALLVLPAILSAAAAYATFAPDSVKQQALVIWELKFANSGEGFFDESDRTRLAYYLGTFEIVARHPVGVSYSGIGPALLETSTFRRGLLKDEDSLIDVNPHNSFLYYIAANGLFGWLATVLFFIWVLRSTWHASRTVGSARVAVFGCCAAVYVVYANTLPSFFNEFSIVAYSSFFLYGSAEPA